MKKLLLTLLGLGLAAVALVPATRDEIQWRWTSQSSEPSRYESYLKAWPDGRHAAEARDTIDSLHWRAAESAGTVRSYAAYASAHPRGRFGQQAETKMTALRADPAPFDAALRSASEKSLTDFVTNYPGHRREAEAQQALRDITVGQDVVDLLDKKAIELRAIGNGIETVSVRIRRLVPYPVAVRIPVGTFFVSSNPAAQNMVTTAASKVQLTTTEWLTTIVNAACANRPKDIPRGKDTFTVQRSPSRAELAKLMPALDRAQVDKKTRQAAVWIATDNADYGDLGVLVASRYGLGGSRVINELETARAMKIFADAGIDITRKAIWQDRQRIIDGLKDADLKTWLQQKK
jgi:hypothetical protein